ncbi:hypothetical protein [Burkholderia gladioli]|uniref:hypothetical protein n=1 Tax=Burkholderia gladioli TaxID=28095 RepID=UPI000F806061
MKERPILFSAPMVRAILDGRKAQTRRVMKPQPVVQTGWVGGAYWERRPARGIEPADQWCIRDALQFCPYGQPGDRLWVRETWSTDFARYYPCERVWYAADDDRRHDIEVRDGVRGIFSPESNLHVPFRWRPSIHMPRALSRITLEITDVRVERLQGISERDAIAEGICKTGSGFWSTYGQREVDGTFSPRSSFQSLWESINGLMSWESNPWVWVIEFARITDVGSES